MQGAARCTRQGLATLVAGLLPLEKIVVSQS